MRRAGSILQRRIALWLPPAVLLVLGSFFLARQLGTARTFGGELEERITDARRQRDTARADERRARELTTGVEQNRKESRSLNET